MQKSCKKIAKKIAKKLQKNCKKIAKILQNAKKKFFFCVKFLQILILHTDFRPREESVKVLETLTLFMIRHFLKSESLQFELLKFELFDPPLTK